MFSMFYTMHPSHDYPFYCYYIEYDKMTHYILP